MSANLLVYPFQSYVGIMDLAQEKNENKWEKSFPRDMDQE